MPLELQSQSLNSISQSHDLLPLLVYKQWLHSLPSILPPYLQFEQFSCCKETLMTLDPISHFEKRSHFSLKMADEIKLSDLPPRTSEVKKVDSITQIPMETSTDSPQDLKSTSKADEEGIVAVPKEVEYPTGIRFAILTISLLLMVFMVALDTTIMCKSPY